MKYKVGDKVRVRKDIKVGYDYGLASFIEKMIPFIGEVTISKIIDGCYEILEDDGYYAWSEEMFEGLANEAPSIVKRINDKHNILNGLLNSDGSVDGEKLMEKLESDSKDSAQKEKFKEGDKLRFVKEYKFPRGGSVLKGSVWKVVKVNIEIYTLLYVGGENSIRGKCGYNMNLPLEVLTSHCEKVEDSEEEKTKGSHYEKAAMQPLEVAQRMFTKEQFKAILAFQVMKYRLRKDYKGQKESDEYKALQYCYWLELVNKDIMINPSKDKVPEGYEYKGVIM